MFPRYDNNDAKNDNEIPGTFLLCDHRKVKEEGAFHFVTEVDLPVWR